jgi:hypothetical protein
MAVLELLEQTYSSAGRMTSAKTGAERMITLDFLITSLVGTG